jgi:hypothetical protein
LMGEPVAHPYGELFEGQHSSFEGNRATCGVHR